MEYYYNNHLLDHLYRTPIFVFTPAKVGGSSIRESIMEHYNNRVPTTFDYVPMLHDLVQGFNRNLLNTNFYKDAVFSCTVEEIKKTIQLRKEKIKIITLFRDPIARNISIIFEAMLTLWIDTDEPYKNFSHWNDLLNYWLEDKIKPESMIDWFDDQLNLVFNINILEHTFDAKAGYTIIEND